jgi:hypothetical protein
MFDITSRYFYFTKGGLMTSIKVDVKDNENAEECIENYIIRNSSNVLEGVICGILENPERDFNNWRNDWIYDIELDNITLTPPQITIKIREIDTISCLKWDVNLGFLNSNFGEYYYSDGKLYSSDNSKAFDIKNDSFLSCVFFADESSQLYPAHVLSPEKERYTIQSFLIREYLINYPERQEVKMQITLDRIEEIKRRIFNNEMGYFDNPDGRQIKQDVTDLLRTIQSIDNLPKQLRLEL